LRSRRGPTLLYPSIGGPPTSGRTPSRCARIRLAAQQQQQALLLPYLTMHWQKLKIATQPPIWPRPTRLLCSVSCGLMLLHYSGRAVWYWWGSQGESVLGGGGHRITRPRRAARAGSAASELSGQSQRADAPAAACSRAMFTSMLLQGSKGSESRLARIVNENGIKAKTIVWRWRQSPTTWAPAPERKPTSPSVALSRSGAALRPRSDAHPLFSGDDPPLTSPSILLLSSFHFYAALSASPPPCQCSAARNL